MNWFQTCETDIYLLPNMNIVLFLFRELLTKLVRSYGLGFIFIMKIQLNFKKCDLIRKNGPFFKLNKIA